MKIKRKTLHPPLSFYTPHFPPNSAFPFSDATLHIKIHEREHEESRKYNTEDIHQEGPGL